MTASAPHTRRVIGIDPGLRFTGWGVIDVEGTRLTHVANGVVTSTEKTPLAARLCEIYDGLSAVIDAHRPAEAAVEQTFVNRDPTATLKLGQARAIALLVPARAGLPVHEYAPNMVKKSVVGVGHADKEQVQVMIRMLLPGCIFDKPDAADALAVAIAHAHRGAGDDRIAAALAAQGEA